jgi:hypothetical protein
MSGFTWKQVYEKLNFEPSKQKRFTFFVKLDGSKRPIPKSRKV